MIQRQPITVSTNEALLMRQAKAKGARPMGLTYGEIAELRTQASQRAKRRRFRELMWKIGGGAGFGVALMWLIHVWVR